MNEVLPGIILACNLRGTILIAFAVLAGPWARRLLGRNGAHWLWLAVLPALLWPLPPRTALSLQNLWTVKVKAVPAEMASSDASKGMAEAMPVLVKVHKLESAEPAVAPQPAKRALPGGEAAGLHRSQIVNAGWWLIRLWLCGVSFMLGQLCWRWRRTKRTLRNARPVTDERATSFLRRFPRGARVSLAVAPGVRAPALAGIWRPRILIPEGWLEELPAAELESVLLHELGHHLRGDLIWEWVFAMARCVHWMNPAVWLAEGLARQERELACDAWALERSAFPAHYGEALLEALKRVHRSPAASFGVVTMANDARQIARRLEWIGRYRPSPRWLAAASWIPAALVLAAVGSDPLAAESDGPGTPGAPSAQGAEQDASAAKTDSPADEPLPLAKRSVEVTTHLVRVPERMVKQLGWPIAEEGSRGVQRVFSRAEFGVSLAILRSAPGVELIPTPRLMSRSGFPGLVQMVREFRFGDEYKATATPGLEIPTTIEFRPLGMSVTWQADIKDENTVHLKIVPRLNRLAGFSEAKGKLTKMLIPPAGTDWQHRLVAYEMPVGTGGSPVFFSQDGDASLDLTSEQIAIVFGFRDLDRTPPPGASKEESMVNYFSVQIGILQ